MKILSPTLVLSLALGCESGTSESYKITVSDTVSIGFSPQGPGVLRVSEVSGAVLALCGDPVPETVEFYVDHGFGCVEDGAAGTEAQRTLYVQPAPAEWDFAALCALDADRHGIELPSEFSPSAAPEVIAPEWFQTSATGTWRRDGSPCGGNLAIDATL